MTQSDNSKVIIVGAGLAGSLLSLYLAKRGIETVVYEARGDIRTEEMSAGRSINLALSDRGIAALREVGMDDFMLREAVPMYGRLIHAKDESLGYLPYSGRKGEYINSISRGGLNAALIDEADKYSESKFYFNKRCIGFDCKTGEAFFEDGLSGEKFAVKGATVIGTDGAGSAIRRSMMASPGSLPRFDYSQRFLEHGYKELSIAPRSRFAGNVPDDLPDAEGEFLLRKNALHIWARHKFMMIALPNFDGSYTCTLFLSFEGTDSFEAIDSGAWDGSGDPKSALNSFFESEFPDALRLMPELVKEYFENPVGNLGTIKCFPWNVGGKALLLGDAAHAVVPFYGQGMNASFEDCRELDRLIGELGDDWGAVFPALGDSRKKNADAIADLANENFFEMRDHVADPVFRMKRELETRLEATIPEYYSKYSLVTFREDIPYSEAQRLGNLQDEFLMRICREARDVESISLSGVYERISKLGNS
ncbi:MAG: NAD(P)/FAD-dependent oxidoreductase [Pyrinomonadaceae bacterium]